MKEKNYRKKTMRTDREVQLVSVIDRNGDECVVVRSCVKMEMKEYLGV